MHNPESVLQKETHKHLLDFKMQVDRLISARPPDLVIVKKNERAEYWTLPSQSKIKIKRKER